MRISPYRPIVDVPPVLIVRNFAHLAVKASTAFLLQGLFFSFIFSPTHPIFQLIKNLVKRFVHVLSKTLASCNSKCEAKVEANPNRSTKQRQQNCDHDGLVALDVGHRAVTGLVEVAVATKVVASAETPSIETAIAISEGLKARRRILRSCFAVFGGAISLFF